MPTKVVARPVPLVELPPASVNLPAPSAKQGRPLPTHNQRVPIVFRVNRVKILLPVVPNV